MLWGTTGNGRASRRGETVRPRREEALLSTAGSIVLLAAAVAALIWLPRIGFLVPPALGAVAIGAGLLAPRAGLHALSPLLAPLGFVLAAVPLAVLLDELGFFEELARRIGAGRHYLGACWVLAGLVTMLLNLDAAVVMLTPLYLRLAERRRVDALALCLQPLLLSCLASSALPISNLTNLIATPALGLSSVGFLMHLGLPTLAATAVGWLAYLRLPQVAGVAAIAPTPSSRLSADRRALVLGGIIVAACVTGFLATSDLGGSPWEVAVGGDLVLVALTRRLPLRVVPWKSVGTVLGLGALAAAIAHQLSLASLFGSSSPLGMLRDLGMLSVGANALNNLPALLVSLPHLSAHPSWSTWAVLLGANVAPLALPSGTLASLLWLETVRRLGVPFGEREYLGLAWKVALPALVAAAAALVALRALLATP